MKINNKAVNSSIWSTLSSLTKSLFQLTQVVILSRYLAKSEFGVLAIALFVLQFTDLFLEMGITSAIIHKQNIDNIEFNSLFLINLTLGVFFVIIISFSSPFISNFYNEPLLKIIIPVLSLNFILISFGRLHKTILQRDLDYKLISTIEIVSQFILISSTLILVFNGYKIFSLVYSNLLASAFANFYFFFNGLHSNKISLSFSYNKIKPFLRIGFYQLGSKIFDNLSNQLDILIIGKMLGMNTLGPYNLIKQLVSKLNGLINNGMSLVILPYFAKKQNNSELLKKNFIISTNIFASINLPVFFSVALVAEQILVILYGKSYSSYSSMLILISIQNGILLIGNTSGALLIALGRTDLGFHWTIFRVFFTVIIISVGCLFSIEIMLLMQLASTVLLFYPYFNYTTKRILNITFREFIISFIYPLLIAFILFVILYFSIIIIFNNNNNLLLSIISLFLFIVGILYFNYKFNHSFYVVLNSLIKH